MGRKGAFLAVLIALPMPLGAQYSSAVGGAPASNRRINGIRFAEQFPGSDACAKIQAASNDLLSTGGTVDARALRGTQTCAAGFAVGSASAGVELLLGGVNLQIGSSVVLLGESSIVGQAGGLSKAGMATITANAAIPSVIQIGTASTGAGPLLSNVYVDGNSKATVGIELVAASSRVTLDNVLVSRAVRNGFQVDLPPSGFVNCCGKIARALFLDNGNAGVLLFSASDWFIGNGTEFEGNGLAVLSIATPPPPAVTPVRGGGSLPAATYYVAETYTGARGETPVGGRSPVTLPATGKLTISSPAPESGATGYNVYISATPGEEVRQNSSPVPLGTDYTKLSPLSTTLNPLTIPPSGAGLELFSTPATRVIHSDFGTNVMGIYAHGTQGSTDAGFNFVVANQFANAHDDILFGSPGVTWDSPSNIVESNEFIGGPKPKGLYSFIKLTGNSDNLIEGNYIQWQRAQAPRYAIDSSGELGSDLIRGNFFEDQNGGEEGLINPSGFTSSSGNASRSRGLSMGMVFANLPSCRSSTEGLLQAVTDSKASAWGETVTGGGTHHILAYCDGTRWAVAAE